MSRRQAKKAAKVKKNQHSRPRTWAALIALVAAASGLSVAATQEGDTPVPEPTAVASATPSATAPETYKVTRVVDGDTIYVDYNGEQMGIRIMGLDTPETVHPTQPVECYGPEASEEAKRVLENAEVSLTTDPTQGSASDTFPGMREDKYDRVLAYVDVYGMDYSAHMIRHGLAEEATYGTKHERADEYRQLEADAAAFGIGMHGAC